MAKGNLFLGTGRKKLGDVVLYRRNGQQQARVRIRNVANPKSYGQALQRNYLAPVSKFYAPLAGVLEKSWEGLNRMDSYQAFLKANIDLARQNGWAVPKGAPFTPLPYKLSKGILPPLSYFWNDETVGIRTDIPVTTSSTIATLTETLISRGYKDGDQLTVVAVFRTTQGDYVPTWFRIFLNSSDQTRLIDYGNGVILFATELEKLCVIEADDRMVAGAIIVSRFDGSKWLRSTQYLAVDTSLMSEMTGEDALAAAVRSYQAGSSLNYSDVYLDGSTQGATEGDTQLTVPVTLSNGRSITFIPQSIAVYDGTGGSAQHLAVLGVDVANGTSYAAWIFNKISGSTNNGKYLATFNSYGNTVVEGEVTSLAFTSADSPLVAWLKNHGVYEEIIV